MCLVLLLEYTLKWVFYASLTLPLINYPLKSLKRKHIYFNYIIRSLFLRKLLSYTILLRPHIA